MGGSADLPRCTEGPDAVPGGPADRTAVGAHRPESYDAGMSSDIGDLPDARVDDSPDRAPGGADAVETAQTDVGAMAGDEPPVTPEEPMSAQQVEGIPQELLEPERSEPQEQASDNTDAPSS